MRDIGCHVIQAEGDADVEIVKAAVATSSYKTTCLIGEDTDLLVLLLHHASSNGEKIYFRSDKGSPTTVLDIKVIKQSLVVQRWMHCSMGNPEEVCLQSDTPPFTKKFIKKGSVEQHIQTDESSRDCDVHEKSDHDTRSDLDSMSLPVLSAMPANTVPNEEPRDSEGRHCNHTENDSETKRYPQRERNPPIYLEEDTLLPKNADYAHISVD
ncbi:Hypothetical predicted protein [Paramuricea clavata]|uniref:Uncharacterized protein n=1 Tax=Paramuricea clavata TaxID=317549 RepID=A0A6S7GMI0_PARCT|nr:Hypothetical predicted protein [Paramuricea clavata]